MSNPELEPAARSSRHFSVVIPTCDGAARLGEVLRRLQGQVGLEAIAWEVWVCDNGVGVGVGGGVGGDGEPASSPATTQMLIQQFRDHNGNLSGWADVPLRDCWVRDRGTAFARQQGIERATGEWVGFLDDDNWPAADWVAQACAFIAQADHLSQNRAESFDLGAFGGQIEAEFEREPPAGFEAIAPFFAIINRGEQPQEYDRRCPVLPPGAGLVVKRMAWRAAVPQQLFLNYTGRGRGLASEDLEALIYLRQAGWQVWHNPAMRIRHQIAADRLEPEAVRSLFRRIGLSRHYIRVLKLGGGRRSPRWRIGLIWSGATLFYGLNDLRKLLGNLLDSLWEINHETASLGKSCDRIYLFYSLLSPWVLIIRALRYALHHSPSSFPQAFPCLPPN